MEDAVRKFFEEAFRYFIVFERANILSRVAERNLCGRLALRLEAIRENFGFADYYADTEYNRKQNGEIKTIINGDFQIIPITCDLIVHSRGEVPHRDNLIAIEMKKADRPAVDTIKDRNRLIAMTTQAPYHDNKVWSNDGVTTPEHVCGYELGIFIKLDVSRQTLIVEAFRRGKTMGNPQHFSLASQATVNTLT